MSFIIRDIFEETTNRQTGAIELIAHIVADDVASLPQNTNDRTFILGSDSHCVQTGEDYMIKSDGTWVKQPAQGGGGSIDAYTKAEVDQLLLDVEADYTQDIQDAMDTVYTKSEIDQLLLDVESDYTQDIQDAMDTVYTKIEVDGLINNVEASIPQEVQTVISSMSLMTKNDAFTGTRIPDGTDLNTIVDKGVYYCPNSTAAATYTNCPVSGAGFMMTVYDNGGNKFRRYDVLSATNTRSYMQSYTSNTWRTPRQVAMKDEIGRPFPYYEENLMAATIWERGAINQSTGANQSSTTSLRTDASYMISFPYIEDAGAYQNGVLIVRVYGNLTDLYWRIHLYNASGTYLGNQGVGVGAQNAVKISNSNARKFRLEVMKDASGTTSITTADLIAADVRFYNESGYND